MVASAILGLIGAGLLTTMSFSARETQATRLRTQAAADAQGELERMVTMTTVNSGNAGTDAKRCELFEAAGGPMDATTSPAAPTGTCPAALGDTRTATGVPIPKTRLTRTVVVKQILLGSKPGLEITITIKGAELKPDVVITTQVRK